MKKSKWWTGDKDRFLRGALQEECLRISLFSKDQQFLHTRKLFHQSVCVLVAQWHVTTVPCDSCSVGVQFMEKAVALHFVLKCISHNVEQSASESSTFQLLKFHATARLRVPVLLLL